MQTGEGVVCIGLGVQDGLVLPNIPHLYPSLISYLQR